MWFLRQAFLAHCQKNNIDYQCFEHWYSPEWSAYLKEWNAQFMVCSLQKWEELDTCDEEEEDEEDVDEESTKADSEVKQGKD